MIWSVYRNTSGVSTMHAFSGWTSLCRKVKSKAVPVSVDVAQHRNIQCADCAQKAAIAAKAAAAVRR